jgi:hypothetical protein
MSEGSGSPGLRGYLGQRKKWWLIPILLFLAVLLALALLTADPARTPFTYKLF